MMKESACESTIPLTELVFKISNRILRIADAEDNESTEPNMVCDYNIISGFEIQFIIFKQIQLLYAVYRYSLKYTCYMSEILFPSPLAPLQYLSFKYHRIIKLKSTVS
jgi:hypothetical protein